MLPRNPVLQFPLVLKWRSRPRLRRLQGLTLPGEALPKLADLAADQLDLGGDLCLARIVCWTTVLDAVKLYEHNYGEMYVIDVTCIINT